MLFGIIPDPGRQKSVTLSLESISTIPFQAGASYVEIPEWGQHCSNRRMPCLVSIFGTFWGTGDQPTKNPSMLYRCVADTFSNITNHEIQWPGMLVARKICPVGLDRCTFNWHNCRSGWKLILCIPPPIARGHLAVYAATFRVCKAHILKIEVHLKCEMSQKQLDTFEKIAVV